MELNAADPIKMSLAGHDKITTGHRPQFPGRIITTRGYNIFLRVVSEARDTHQVAFECFLTGQMRTRWFELFVYIRVHSVELRHLRGRVRHFEGGGCCFLFGGVRLGSFIVSF